MESYDEFLYLLDGCAQKDRTAWDNFVKRYSSIIYNYILRTLKRYFYSSQNGEIDDIYNQVFLSLLDKDCKSLRNFQGQNERSFMAYLRVIIFNLTVDFLRRKKSYIDFEQIRYCISDNDEYWKVENKDLKKVISMIRDDLPERHKYLFKLLYEEQINLSEIAEMMNMKLNAVHQLKFRMIKNIRKIAKKKNLYNELEKYLVSCPV